MAKKNKKKNSGVGFAVLGGLFVAGVLMILKKKSSDQGSGVNNAAGSAADAYAARSMSRAQALNILAAAGHKSSLLSDPRAYQDGYLIAWAKSVQRKQDVFTFQGRQFISQTGTSR